MPFGELQTTHQRNDGLRQEIPTPRRIGRRPDHRLRLIKTTPQEHDRLHRGHLKEHPTFQPVIIQDQVQHDYLAL